MSTTTKLLDAAEYRMRRGGYNAVSFRDLANDTNIKSSSVHYHYPKKENLGQALIQRYSERFFEALEQMSATTEAPREKLLAYRALYRHALTEDGAVCLCGLLGSELAGLPDILTNDVQQFFKSNMKWIEDALPDTMPLEMRQISASSLLAGLQGAMMLSNSLDDIELFDKTTDNLIEDCLRYTDLEHIEVS